MWDQINLWQAGGGLVLGMAFGIVAQRSRFCVVAAVSNFALMRDYRQLHAYLAALAVAVAGTFALEWSQLVAIAEAGYRRPALNWMGALGGGLVFGVGAMLAGGCASRTLIRTAEGNLGALLTLLVFAVVGMATLFGALDPLRGWVLAQAMPLGSDDASLSAIMHWPAWILPLAVVLACLVTILLLGRWRDHKGIIAGGILIGLLIVAGWWVTGMLGRVAAYLAGGALMGFGAVLAGGCNIGQGLSGAATLSVTSLLAVAGILTGMLLGMYWVSRSG